MDTKGTNARNTASVLLAPVLFIKQLLRYALISVKKNALFAACLFLFIGVAGFYYNLTRKPYYETDMACMSDNMNRKTIGEIVQKLNILVKAGSYEQLAATLQLPVGTVSSIISLEAKNSAGKMLYADTAQEQHGPMYIIVKANDNKVFAPLERYMVTFLNNNPFQIIRAKTELRRIDDKVQFMNRNIAAMDSIISGYPAFLRKVKSVHDSVSGFTDVVGLLSFKDRLEDRVLQAEGEKSYMQSLEVIHGFLPTASPEQKDGIPVSVILWTAFVSTLLGAIIVNALKHGV